MLQKLPNLTFLLCVLLMVSCKPAPAVEGAQNSTKASVVTATVTATTTLTPTTTASPTAPLTDTPQPAPRLCTPLQGLPLGGMAGLISNPYHPPRPGYDDPHAGIDLAVRMLGSQVAVSGQPVQAALAGQIAMLVKDRFPFGNALVIETPLENFPAEWWATAQLPAPAPTLEPRSALTCPSGPQISIPDPSRRSLYILYAHMQAPPALQLGDPISCGQVIGAVGQSGNALNPHLHFEARVAPSGLRLTGMSHYDASATPDEMSSYCLWSVSGVFELVDPLKVLNLVP